MNDISLSVVLCAMGRLELADFGFRSWMLQTWDQPYEVILSLFNDQQPRYEALTKGKNPNCRVIIRSYDRPEFYNSAAANNLGLHFATGEYVLFANCDIIYPSTYAERFIRNMRRHNCGYAVGSRYNLSSEETAALGPVAQYTLKNNFDFLDVKSINPPVAVRWVTCGPWMIRRDLAQAIGCFDPAVPVSEDDDICSRAVHYLARHGGQESAVSFFDMYGFHLYHATTEVFALHHASHLILEPRRERLRAQPDSNEDIVPNRLDDLNSLIEQVRKTKKPPALAKYRQDTFRKISGRIVAATKVLLGRR
jgi:GT2 family glycosyltransferase